MEVAHMQKRKHRNILLTLAIVAFAAYIIVSLISVHSQIKDKQTQLDSLNRQIEEQTQENLDSRRLLSEEDEETYIERYAREKLGFARPEERVYYSITG